jgi:hypothetical protein
MALEDAAALVTNSTIDLTLQAASSAVVGASSSFSAAGTAFASAATAAESGNSTAEVADLLDADAEVAAGTSLETSAFAALAGVLVV